MAPNPESTKQQLIAAAETLFAERGIEGVSLREINTAAGQKNSTALQYHFADRRGLVRAVLDKHTPDVDAARHALLDAYVRVGRDDLRELAAALVRPSAAKLADIDGGRAYLQVNAQVLNRPELRFDEARSNLSDSVNRWRQLVGPLLPDVAVRRLHHRFTAIRVSSTELARRACTAPRRDDRLFTSHLIDLVAALLAAPVSEQTAALLRARG
ncbi:MAG: TetR family transcriptional regulator [Schumannella sp.]|jgi:AcrR family transcriptional regulator|nr:TetR family transcriptional regulator [Schumannella sp.]